MFEKKNPYFALKNFFLIYQSVFVLFLFFFPDNSEADKNANKKNTVFDRAWGREIFVMGCQYE